MIGPRIRHCLSQLFDAGNGADRTHGATMHFESAPRAKATRPVNGRTRRERGADVLPLPRAHAAAGTRLRLH